MVHMRTILLLFCIALATSVLLYIILGIGNTTQRASSPDIVFIEERLSPREFVHLLQERGLITNKLSYYQALLAVTLKGGPMLGGYDFSRGVGAAALYDTLSDPEYRHVSIIEGMRKEEIAERIGHALEWDPEKIAEFKNQNPLCALSGREGYLASGTYMIKKDADIQSIQTEMEEKFQEKLSIVLEKYSDTVLNTDQIITIASLIQREAGSKSDMRLISGIIWNRLLIGMPLQIDATLQYVKGDDGRWWPRVRPEDKHIDSPYNTYKNDGLPPGPIANPGIAALEAAMNPVDTDCLFYLHDAQKNIHCAADYEAHLENIERYLR